MTSASINFNFKFSTLLGVLLLSFSLLLGVQGCSSSSSTLAPQDSDPVGYFTGSATLDATTINSPDMIGLAYGSRVMIFNMAENVLLDITLTDITLTDFTGTVDVYIGGDIQGAGGTTVTGTTNNSQIEGTFTFAADSGFTAGSFDILYDTNNNIGASLSRADGDVFFGTLAGIDTGTDGFADLNITGTYDIGDTTTEKCEAFGNLVVPDSNVNVYKLLHDVESLTGGTCAFPHLDTGYTGFGSVISDIFTDDTFVFAYANGNVALFSKGLTR